MHGCSGHARMGQRAVKLWLSEWYRSVDKGKGKLTEACLP